MVPRTIKVAYYFFLAPVMRLNAWRHRVLPTRLKLRRAHLGPGQKNYLIDWINVDANLVTSKPDIWADLRHQLPFPDQSLDAIYSHHVVEHLPDLDFHFREMFRVLRPGGKIRVGGPNGDAAMRAYLEGYGDWCGSWPTNRRSVGGRFENFIFCKGEHLTILTEGLLREIAEDSGFEQIEFTTSGKSRHENVFGDVFSKESESTPDLPKTLLVEAVKPIP